MKFRGQRNPVPDFRGSVFVSHKGVEKPLSPAPSRRVVAHSDRFDWGDSGKSGGFQLAVALLLEVTQHPEFVLTYYSDFERSVVGGLAYKSWELSAEEIRDWIGEWKVVSALLGFHTKKEMQSI